MKKFRFQLEPVLDFKQQQLEALLVELNAALAQVSAQQRRCDEANRRLTEYDEECARKREEGMTIVEAMQCQSCQTVLEQRCRREAEQLLRLQKEAERRRNDVVEARKETHSLEKLREFRRSEYDSAAMKEEEKFIDDLTAARRAMASGE